MAVIRNTAAMRLRGKVGNTTYYTQGRRQIARVSENSSNYGEDARRSPAQQRRRVMWANLVNFYKISANWMHGAFETKKANESDYNRFMSLNLPNARVALPRDLAIQGCCVADAFVISQGTLQSVELVRSENTAQLSILSNFSAAQIANASIANFSKQLLQLNPWMLEGMQLSFIQYSSNGSASKPMAQLGREEITLSTTDSTQMSTLSISEHLDTSATRLIWKDLDPDAYIAVIVSDSTHGPLRVSTQSLIPGDENWPAGYATEDAINAAIATYGVDPERFLDSGGY